MVCPQSILATEWKLSGGAIAKVAQRALLEVQDEGIVTHDDIARCCEVESAKQARDVKTSAHPHWLAENGETRKEHKT